MKSIIYLFVFFLFSNSVAQSGCCTDLKELVEISRSMGVSHEEACLYCCHLRDMEAGQGGDSPPKRDERCNDVSVQLERKDIINQQTHSSQDPNPRKMARDGNVNYKDNLYPEAEIQYRKSLSENKSFNEAKFNLSNSLFKQGRYNESLDLLNDMIKTTHDSIFKSEVYYNMGNNHMMMANDNTQDPNLINESLNNAINSYKNCLKINPSDEEARHNLSKALRLLQKQKQNQNNDQERDKEKQEKQNSGQTDGEEEENENKKEKNDDESKEGGKSNSTQKEQEDFDSESLGGQLSKEDIQRMLEALDREEKEVQEKMRKINFSKQKNKQIEKDW